MKLQGSNAQSCTMTLVASINCPWWKGFPPAHTDLLLQSGELNDLTTAASTIGEMAPVPDSI